MNRLWTKPPVKKTLSSGGAFLLIVVASFSLITCSVVAQEGTSVQSPMPVKTLGQVDYVEINMPAVGSEAKQLIIFVHGTPGPYSAFSSYLNDPIMKERFHMISVTRPGWRNAEDEKQPSLAVQSEALEPFLHMDKSGKGALLMAHSYGGPVIARTAMDYPDLIAGLIFVATTGDPQLSGPRWYNRFAVVLPRFILGDSLKGANAEILPLKAQLEQMLPRWESLTMPALIVQGDKDHLVSPGNAVFMQRMLVNSDVKTMFREGQGHFVLWEEEPLIRDTLIEKFQSRE